MPVMINEQLKEMKKKRPGRWKPKTKGGNIKKVETASTTNEKVPSLYGPCNQKTLGRTRRRGTKRRSRDVAGGKF